MDGMDSVHLDDNQDATWITWKDLEGPGNSVINYRALFLWVVA
jgi:hypothetical protein